MKSAHWIRKTHLLRADEYICSECGAVCSRPRRVCPRCRSAMGKTRYDPSWADEAEEMSALLEDD